uniref:Uncharacterized protein n=1 Tax=Anguilla anguilla TaxID=7936 RepID=A0A0E9WI46_ANGAN
MKRDGCQLSFKIPSRTFYFAFKSLISSAKTSFSNERSVHVSLIHINYSPPSLLASFLLHPHLPLPRPQKTFWPPLKGRRLKSGTSLPIMSAPLPPGTNPWPH